MEDSPAPAEVPLSAKIDCLSRPETYAATREVSSIETHFSWVFLTDTRAYKLKKPVREEFLDFTTLDARRLDCLEELRLNRRLAPEIYLDVIPLVSKGTAGLALGGRGRVVDWLVEMRRLAAERMLDRAITAGTVDPTALRHAIRRLAEFYRGLPSESMDAEEYRRRFLQDLRAARNVFAAAPAPLARAARGATRILAGFVRRHPACFDRRIARGRIIEGHGDLRPEHVWLGEPPVFIDCLEFNRGFRVLDPVDELSFLAMECERLGAPDIGAIILATYFAATPDSVPAALIAFYQGFRACLRAKLAFRHTQDPAVACPDRWLRRSREYLVRAEIYADRLD